MKGPDYEKIKQLEKEIEKLESRGPPKKTGVAVVKKQRNLSKKTEPAPTKVYRGNQVEVSVETRDRTLLKVPGNVQAATPMRIQDALKRGVITEKMVSELLSIVGVAIFDRVIIMPAEDLDKIVGYDVEYREKFGTTEKDEIKYIGRELSKCPKK
jgi:hypothetical protein